MLLLAAGCGQSLFDAHGRRGDGGMTGDDDAPGDGPIVPSECPADTCLADAAADFKSSQGGTNGHWRYLEDKRNRTWALMSPNAGAMVGAEQNNRIEPCAGSQAAGCKALPGALLVSSSAQASDPAIEYRSFEAKVVQLALRVHVDTTAQRVRLYRNSREDVLFTASASPGETVTATITVDAIVNDKFLIALEPTAGAGVKGTAALHFFVIDAKASFPRTCQLAVPFTVLGTAANSVRDVCGGHDLAFRQAEVTTSLAPRQDAFGDPSGAAYFEPSLNFKGSAPLARGTTTTIQFWAIADAGNSYPIAWLFSDIDENNGGGLGVRFNFMPTLRLEAAVPGAPTYPSQGIAYPTDAGWHFVRVIHAGGMVTICLDGTQAKMGALAGPATSNQPPYLGRNGIWDTTNYLLGGIDDVRVFSEALPCN